MAWIICPSGHYLSNVSDLANFEGYIVREQQIEQLEDAPDKHDWLLDHATKTWHCDKCERVNIGGRWYAREGV